MMHNQKKKKSIDDGITEYADAMGKLKKKKKKKNGIQNENRMR